MVTYYLFTTWSTANSHNIEETASDHFQHDYKTFNLLFNANRQRQRGPYEILIVQMRPPHGVEIRDDQKYQIELPIESTPSPSKFIP